MAEQQDEQQKQLQVHVDKDIARGVYSNMAEIKHSKEEFCIDFYNMFPPMGSMVARVMVSPGHLKRMISAFRENLDKYERRHGPVQEAEQPPFGVSPKK
jgi:hypothetical protein